MEFLRNALIVFMLLIPTGFAQTSPTAVDRSQLGGKYSGRAQEQGGGPRWTDMAVSFGKPADDGRFTGSVQAFRAGPNCGRPLPVSGEVLPDGSVRMEIKTGSDVPAGCERTYDLKLLAGGRLSGTSAFSGYKFDVELKRTGD